MAGLSSAEVPIIVQASLLTLILSLLGTKEYISIIFKIVIKFIIFVREAIYLLLKLLRPQMYFSSLI